MCCTASAAVATFAARTGQLIRDIVRLHGSVRLVLDEVSGGARSSTHPSLGSVVGIQQFEGSRGRRHGVDRCEACAFESTCISGQPWPSPGAAVSTPYA